MLAETVADLNDLPIRIEPGNNVYLRDIGHAEDSYAIQTSRVRINGKPQVYVPIYRQGGASSLAVANGVKEPSRTWSNALPDREPNSISSWISRSTSREAIHSLIHEGFLGAILVSIMILIFLGNWRMTLIASLSIPLAILGAIIWPVRDRQHDQRHDAGRSGPGHWAAGGRCHRRAGEQSPQL